MVTDIIFDLGGVLLDLNMPGVGIACKRLGINPELFFVKADADNTSTVCQGISASKAITDYQVGKMTSEEFLTLVVSQCAEGIQRMKHTHIPLGIFRGNGGNGGAEQNLGKTGRHRKNNGAANQSPISHIREKPRD